MGELQRNGSGYRAVGGTKTEEGTMKRRYSTGKALLALAVVVGVLSAPACKTEKKEHKVAPRRQVAPGSGQPFGIARPLAESAPATSGAYRTAEQTAKEQVLLAGGLKVEYLTREAANATDMMALYPPSEPTHLISCVEEDREELGGKFNPSVQRIDLKTGKVETILRGMNHCDGIRATVWGTILATEERNDGSAYEILDPLKVTGEIVSNRGAAGAPATVTGAGHVVKRTALPAVAWEGLTVLASGVVIGGDELRPGKDVLDRDGGAIYKFVPDHPRAGDGIITDLEDSPLTAGKAYALQVSCTDSGDKDFPQYGQGCEVGVAVWVRVEAATARADAAANGATGYFRPEDLQRDPYFHDPEHPEAIRFCWSDTGNEAADNFGEVMCAVDQAPLPDSPGEIIDPRSGFTYLTDNFDYAVASVNRFVEGDPDFNSFDNLEFQPGTGNLYVLEDHDNGDIFACLPDGDDRDIKSDGCIKVLSVKDSSAEPTGFLFGPDGKTAYLSIQHSDDAEMPMFEGYRTDDVLKITGFKVR